MTMSKQKGLSDVQVRVIEAIERYFLEHGIAPEYRDIMKTAGIKSHGSLMASLYALRRYGIVDWQDGKSRTIRVSQEHPETEVSVRKSEPVVPITGGLSDVILDYAAELGYRARRMAGAEAEAIRVVVDELSGILRAHQAKWGGA